MAHAAFLIDDGLNDHDALNPRLAGLGWKPLSSVADELGGSDAPAHSQSVLKTWEILWKVGAGET